MEGDRQEDCVAVLLHENDRLQERVHCLETQVAQLTRDNAQLRETYEARLRKLNRKLTLTLAKSRSLEGSSTSVEATRTLYHETDPNHLQIAENRDEAKQFRDFATEWSLNVEEGLASYFPEAHLPTTAEALLLDGEGESETNHTAGQTTTDADPDRAAIDEWLESRFTPAQRQMPLLAHELERRRAPLEEGRVLHAHTTESDDGAGDQGNSDDGDGEESPECAPGMTQCTTINDLPAEVLCVVFAAMQAPKDVLACAATCRTWAAILGCLPCSTVDGYDAEDGQRGAANALWKTLVLTNKQWLKHGSVSALVPPLGVSWKQYYRMRCHSTRNWEQGLMMVHTIPLSSMVKSFDYRPGGMLTSLSAAGGIHYYDVVTGASLGKISVPFIPQCHQQLDPLVMVGGSEGKLHLYHDDARLLASYSHQSVEKTPETVSSLACNLALEKFVSATSSAVTYWDIISPKPLWTLPTAANTTVLHFDNQKIMAAARGVTVYDAKSGGRVCALKLDEPVTSLACLNSFTTVIASAHSSYLWDLRMPQFSLPRYLFGRCCALPSLERVVFADYNVWMCSYDSLFADHVPGKKNVPLTLWQTPSPGVVGAEVKQVRMDQDRIVIGQGQAIHVCTFVHNASTQRDPLRGGAVLI